MAHPIADEAREPFPIAPRQALRLARRLARADARGDAGSALGEARRRLREAGLADEEAGYATLVLLGLGLRERGHAHARVTERLLTCSDPDAAAAAVLDTARLVRRLRPDLEPARLEALRRRAGVLIFLAFALWGAIGARILLRLF